MANYYYSVNPDVEHNKHSWQFELLGNNLTFFVDNGVFSKSRVDYGTCVLLEAIQESNLITEQTKKILDVGCGYGPIGLSLAKKYPQLVSDMVDVNELALQLASENAQVNHISNTKIWSSNTYDTVEDTDYDLVISNPPIRAGKQVVHQILTDAKQHLTVGGSIVVVIQKKQGAPSAQKKLEETYGNCEVLKRDKGYFILKSVYNG